MNNYIYVETLEFYITSMEAKIRAAKTELETYRNANAPKTNVPPIKNATPATINFQKKVPGRRGRRKKNANDDKVNPNTTHTSQPDAH